MKKYFIRPLKHVRSGAIFTSIILLHTTFIGITLSIYNSWAANPIQMLSQAKEPLQDLRIGQFYPAGLRVRSPQLGISFVVPRDWRVQLAQGAGVIHMDSAKREGIGVIHLLEQVTREEVEARLNEPQSFEAAYVLDPDTPITIKDNQLSSTYRHGDQIGAALAILGPGSQAVVYLMAGPITERKYFTQILHQLSTSTHFLAPDQSALLKTWYHRLNDNQLTGLETIPSSKGHEWHFCSTGRFVHHYHPQITDRQPKDSAGFEEAGPWYIDIQDKKVLLVVTPDFALPRRFTVGMAEDSITLNNERFMKQRSHTCF